ncbi:MAG: glycosyltransferase family 2 protein [Patescibacteria group bacterium]|nr:glycosyltransferase family 2 protein [Patescibacteria group bacterium]
MNLTIIVLTSNNQDLIKGCLNSIKSLGDILIIDDQSTDDTIDIAKNFKVTILKRKLDIFPKQRTFAIKQAKTPWVLFLDSDERLSSSLRKEIKTILKNPQHSAYKFKRLNYFFGKLIKHGGYWPDWQTRLFKVKDFDKFSGAVHETPHYKGSLGKLENHLIHFTHKSLVEGLRKSIDWTKVEANEFIKSNHPPVKWWHLLKAMVKEFFFRYFKKKGFLDGYIGFTESLIQSINRFFVYQQIWEMQQKPTIKKQYQKLDQTLK